MTETLSYVNDFYAGQKIQLPATVYVENRIRSDSVGLSLSDRQRTVTEEEVMNKIQEIEWTVVHRQGSQFEIGRVNHSTATTPDTLLHLSTYSSSLSGNPGNLYELAYQAAIYPNTPMAYVASFGNGQTSALTSQEQAWARKTGRLTWEDEGRTVALPSIQQLVGALAAKDILVTTLDGNSWGSVAGVAVGTALPEAQVTAAAFNTHPQFTNVHPASLLGRMLIKEMLINGPAAARHTPDPWPVNEERTAAVRQARPDIYTPANANLVDTREHINMLMTNAIALARGIGRDGVAGNNPIRPDLAAFFEKQPKVQANFIVPTRDPLQTHQLGHNILMLVNHFGTQTEHRPALLSVVEVPDMPHAFNTHYLQLYQAIKGALLALADAA